VSVDYVYRSDIDLLALSRFGWTGYRSDIHWAAPASAGFCIGFGVLCIFLPCFNYVVEAYLPM
jgi:DHA1 family multidrug resistance protein-like MFS transporter